ncbi:MAG: hypothetical protein AAFP82_10690 [Bacteroidota bacterium]
MISATELQGNIIALIKQITDENRLANLYQVVEEEVNSVSESQDVFQVGAVEIRENISKDEIFEEQENRSINYQEIRAIFNDVEWEYTLDEMLATLD